MFDDVAVDTLRKRIHAWLQASAHARNAVDWLHAVYRSSMDSDPHTKSPQITEG